MTNFGFGHKFHDLKYFELEILSVLIEFIIVLSAS